MSNLALNTPVTYISSKGYAKAAVVTGTPDSILADKNVAIPAEGHVHLTVFSVNGKVYTRRNVPTEAVAQAKAEANAYEGEVAEIREYVKA